MKLIDKDALVAEIEKKISSCYLPTEYTAGVKYGLGEALKIINTLEVKEVDLEKEITLTEEKYYGFESLSRADVIEIIKHFFELGLKAQKGE